MNTRQLSLYACGVLLWSFYVIRSRCRIPLHTTTLGLVFHHSQDRKIATTSFLDSSFMKTLASAIRFGTPLLVQVLLYCSQHSTCCTPYVLR